MKNFTLLALCAMLFSTGSLVAQPTNAPTAPPTRNTSDVISLFSEAYTDVAGTIWFPNWGQSTVVTDEVISSNNVKKYATLNYQGIQFQDPIVPINAASMTHLHLDIWTPNCTAFDVFLINTTPSTVEHAFTINPTLSGWNSIDIPLTAFTSSAPVVALSNIGQIKLVGTPFGTSTVWLDNLYFWKPANVPTITGFTVPAKIVGDAPFALTAPTSNSSGAFTYMSDNSSVATISGNTVTIVGAGTALITANQAAAGAFAAGSTSAVLTVTSAGPTVSAATPTKAAADVISMFSNAYSNVNVDTWKTSWSNATFADVQVAGNDTKKYTALDFAGIETTTNQLNVTAMTGFHMDIWTPDAAEFKVKLVDFGANAAFGGGDDKEHELTFSPTLSGWFAIDAPLSAFTNLTTKEHIAQLIIVGVGTGKSVWVDNVYFYKAVVPPSAPTAAAPTPTVPVANVISLFSNAYTDLAGTNWNPGWGQATVYSEVMVAGNTTKKYENLNFQGAEPASTINATAATFLHVDVWTPTTPSPVNFRIKLVDYGTDGTYQGMPDTEHELEFTPAGGVWTSLDIPLADFTGLAARAHLAQFIISSTTVFLRSGDKSGLNVRSAVGPTFYLDNIYFYSNTALAVELTNLTAKSVNKTTVLNWQTATEKDNQGFTIERSVNGTDYSAIGQVKGNGTTNSVRNYTFTDAAPANGVNYYRLRQADLNGKETLSKVVSVISGKNFLILKNTLVQNLLDVTVGEDQKGPLSIFNVSGQLVYSAKVQGNQLLDISALASGLYIVRTETGDVSRFVKE
jgi:hypothetical protein